LNDDGLLERLPAWVFIEWSRANDFVQDVNYPANMLYAAALEAAAGLYNRPEYANQAKQVRQTVLDIGYDHSDKGFDGTTCAVMVTLDKQSPDIAQGVDTSHEVRDQGKVIFLVIRDATGDLQLFTRINVVGEEAFEAIRELDLGDWVGAVGAVMRTRRGELSVAPTVVTLLSKSLRPLPDKHSGLSDTETRYRQRYVDLIVNPEVRDVFTTRFKIVVWSLQTGKIFCTAA